MRLDQLFPIAVDLPIKHPDGSDTGIRLKVVGQDSTQFRNVVRKFAKRFVEEKTPAVETLEQQQFELIAACIVGWTGIDDAEYSPEKALEIISDPRLSFIREQVERYIADRGNFFRRGEEGA